MKETWNYDLVNLLENAKLEDNEELDNFISKYSLLAVTNEDLTILLLFRHFNVSFWNEERRITNCHPEKEDFQCGITIVRVDDDGSSIKSNIYLPNNLRYKELKIKDQQIEIITDDKKITTNLTELYRKMRFFKRSITEEEIEVAFNNLCDEQYEKPKKLEVKNKTIKIPSIGKLTYDEEIECFEGKFKVENKVIEVSVHNAEPKELALLISFVDKQIIAKFYDEILLHMESKMVNLKNDAWLGEDDETGEDEPPMTKQNFRKRISISRIVFYEDCSSSIYCNDDDIFWGHTIEISVDVNGNYKDANLAG